MKINTLVKTVGILAISTFAFTSANAGTFSQKATVKFVTPITVTQTTQMNFGTVNTGGTTNQTLILSTAGAITGTASAKYISGAAVGDYAVTAGGSTISVLVNNFTADTVTLSAPKCSYDGAAEADCSTAITGLTAGAAKSLKVGATLTLAGSEAAGLTYTPGFDIVVNYE